MTDTKTNEAMSDARCTPVPWVARQQFKNRWLIECLSNKMVPVSLAIVTETVMEVGTSGSRTGPNARLITAAVNSYGKLPDPIKAAESDLLGEALDAVRHHVKYCRSCDGTGCNRMDAPRACSDCAKARFVLAKAGAIPCPE